MAFKKATTVSNTTSTAEILEEAAYEARIVQIIDIGLQKAVPNPKIVTPKDQYKLVIKFELSDEFMSDESGKPDPKKPRWFDFEVAYTPDGYMHPKSILLKLWNAVGATEDWDLKDLVGKPVSVMLSKYIRKSGKNVGKEANKVSAVIKMKEKLAAKLPPLVNPPLFFDLAEPDLAVFKSLPSGNEFAIQERILANMNFEGSKLDCLIRGVEYVETEGEEEAQEPQAPKEDAAEETKPATKPVAQQADDSDEEEDVYA